MKLESGYEYPRYPYVLDKSDPAFDPIRNEPRFKEYIEKDELGLGFLS
jgi:hypothetical protein